MVLCITDSSLGICPASCYCGWRRTHPLVQEAPEEALEGDLLRVDDALGVAGEAETEYGQQAVVPGGAEELKVGVPRRAHLFRPQKHRSGHQAMQPRSHQQAAPADVNGADYISTGQVVRPQQPD